MREILKRIIHERFQSRRRFPFESKLLGTTETIVYWWKWWTKLIKYNKSTPFKSSFKVFSHLIDFSLFQYHHLIVFFSLPLPVCNWISYSDMVDPYPFLRLIGILLGFNASIDSVDGLQSSEVFILKTMLVTGIYLAFIISTYLVKLRVTGKKTRAKWFKTCSGTIAVFPGPVASHMCLLMYTL